MRMFELAILFAFAVILASPQSASTSHIPIVAGASGGASPAIGTVVGMGDTLYMFSGTGWFTCTGMQRCISGQERFQVASISAQQQQQFNEIVANPDLRPDGMIVGMLEPDPAGGFQFVQNECAPEEPDCDPDAPAPEEPAEVGDFPEPYPLDAPPGATGGGGDSTPSGTPPPATGGSPPASTGDAARSADPLMDILRQLYPGDEFVIQPQPNGQFLVVHMSGGEQRITVQNNVILLPDGRRITLQALGGGGYSATTTVSYSTGRNTITYVTAFDGNADGVVEPGNAFRPQDRVTSVSVNANGITVVQTDINPGVEYIYSRTGVDGALFSALGEGTIRVIETGQSASYLIRDFGSNGEPDTQGDQYTLVLPDNRRVQGTAFTADGQLLDGERPVAAITADGIQANFRNIGGEYRPTTIMRADGVTFQRTYDKDGNILTSTGYVNGRAVAQYNGEERGEPAVQYQYNERGQLAGIKDSRVCPTGECTFEEYNRRRKIACDANQKSTDCERMNQVVDPFRAGFWDRWGALRQGTAAGQGFCSLIDMLGASCGDSLFPAFDDFMQNTVIGNVLSGETSALCTLWTDNAEESGAVALGPGGFAAAWVAAEYIPFSEPEERNGTLIADAPPRAQFLTKITFEVRPNGIVGGECKEQIVTVRVLLDGQLIDLDFNGRVDDADTIKLQCDKGGYSAVGRNAVMRYLNSQPNTVCLEINGDLNNLFELSLEGGKLCNKVVAIEAPRGNFECTTCVFGDTPIDGPSEPPPATSNERRPQVGNPE